MVATNSGNCEHYAAPFNKRVLLCIPEHNWQNEKAACEMGESICKSCKFVDKGLDKSCKFRQKINIQILSRTTTQQQQTDNPIEKRAKDLNRLLQRWSTDDHQTCWKGAHHH